jgi:L-alanine-DL-glutamate epimerase-like enolase superfamily enzyme
MVLDIIKGLHFAAPPELDTASIFYETYLKDIPSQTLKCGFDTAVWDLYAKQRGQAGYQLFEGGYQPKPNSVTVCIKPTLEATAEDARQIIRNFPHLRVMKIKLSGEGDVERCRAIRQVVPEGLGYILDANQAYCDPDQGYRVMCELRDLLGNIVVIEQPTPKDDLDALKRMTQLVNFAKVYADESCCDERDLGEILARDAAHGVNIKLQKAGGVTPALRMLRELERRGRTAMLGCMMELSVAIAPAVHLGVSHGPVIVTDLDSDLALFSVGPCSLGFADGCRTGSFEPGFGCELDPPLIAKAEREGKLSREVVATWEF